MNKNKDYFEFVEYIKKEVQNVINDWRQRLCPSLPRVRRLMIIYL